MSALPESSAGLNASDTDAQETREWLEALDAVISAEGPERAHFLLEQLIEEARQNGIDRPIVSQPNYNAMNRMPEVEHFPACGYYGLGIVPYSPLGRGMLSGQIRSIDDLAENDFRRSTPRFQGENFQRNLDVVDEVKRLAAARGVSLRQRHARALVAAVEFGRVAFDAAPQLWVEVEFQEVGELLLRFSQIVEAEEHDGAQRADVGLGWCQQNEPVERCRSTEQVRTADLRDGIEVGKLDIVRIGQDLIIGHRFCIRQAIGRIRQDGSGLQHQRQKGGAQDRCRPADGLQLARLRARACHHAIP